ncbi:glycoprotein [Wuhan Louse Fly Virus 5]|uniref:Glycoprotein n=1 Tax=Wuhan Louse Fly Virus 5 TaxID=1608119 RepID=A0A0B5KKB0_9RHAB|nr:glycoprotein [Wuhan Louse Fly Virus 5]AJG39200.1 glycoprotein [Wuhan Louse Fly Virus 5]
MIAFLILIACANGYINDNDTEYVWRARPLGSVADKGVLYVPLDHSKNWRPAKYQDLKCPKPQGDWQLKFIIHTRWVTWRPDDISLDHIPGFLCHKAEWITRCEYTWYLSKTVSRKLKEETPSESECQDAVRLYEAGKQEAGSFPPEECYWNSVNDESVVKTIVVEHSIAYDPYKDCGVDEALVGGSCKKKFCDTKYSSVKWVQDVDHESQRCHNIIQEQLEILKRNDNKEQDKSWVRSKSFPITEMDDACKMSFCGLDGIRLKNGIWFGFQKSRTDHSDMGDIPQCVSGTEIGIPDKNYKEKEFEYELEDLQREILCLNVLDKLQLNQVISLYDLQYLRQDAPGYGNIFRVNNGTLEVTTGKYIKVYHAKNDLSPDCIGTYKDHSGDDVCVDWDEWLPIEKDKDQGFNGIIRIKNKIIFPDDQLRASEWREELFDYFKVDKIHHPFLNNVTDVIHDDTDDENLIHDKTVNPGDAINNWVKVAENKVVNFFKELGIGIIIIVWIIAGIIFLFILFKLIRFCIKLRYKKVNTGDKEIEMRHYDSPIFG